MQVGDLVRHRTDGCYGTVMGIKRRKLTNKIGGLAQVYWPKHNCTVLHPIGQLEVINEI